MGLLQDAIRPYARAGGFYARSWRRYLDGDYDGELPVVRPTVALAGQAFSDEVVLVGFRLLRNAVTPADLARIHGEVTEARALYESRGWFEDPLGYLGDPPPLTEVTVRPVVAGRRSYDRVSFDSGYEPHEGDPGRERWMSYAPNRRVHAWMLRHPEPRPWLVAVHGAGMGRPAMDMAIFRARRLHEELGLNVLMPALPLHGPRRRGLGKDAAFPGEDILDDVHGAAQSVWDIRRLISWIRAEEGFDARIGLSGISLGGYVTALVASTEPGLTVAVLGVPVADLVDLLDRHAGPAPTPTHLEVVEEAKRIGRVVSPLALEPLLPPQGRFIYAGLADRLVHPRHQVSRLYQHWGRPQIEWYPGGHTGFFRSRPVQDFVERALRDSGLVDPNLA